MKEVTLEIYKGETIYIAKFETDRTTLTCLKNLKWSFLKAGDSNFGATQGRNYIYWHARSWRQLLQGMKLSILAHQKLTAAIARYETIYIGTPEADVSYWEVKSLKLSILTHQWLRAAIARYETIYIDTPVADGSYCQVKFLAFFIQFCFLATHAVFK